MPAMIMAYVANITDAPDKEFPRCLKLGWRSNPSRPETATNIPFSVVFLQQTDRFGLRLDYGAAPSSTFFLVASERDCPEGLRRGPDAFEALPVAIRGPLRWGPRMRSSVALALPHNVPTARADVRRHLFW